MGPEHIQSFPIKSQLTYPKKQLHNSMPIDLEAGIIIIYLENIMSIIIMIMIIILLLVMMMIIRQLLSATTTFEKSITV